MQPVREEARAGAAFLHAPPPHRSPPRDVPRREGGGDAERALRLPGLYCIGEAVDVTGWLGGYNFQWAWASAYAAATAVQR